MTQGAKDQLQASHDGKVPHVHRSCSNSERHDCTSWMHTQKRCQRHKRCEALEVQVPHDTFLHGSHSKGGCRWRWEGVLRAGGSPRSFIPACSKLQASAFLGSAQASKSSDPPWLPTENCGCPPFPRVVQRRVHLAETDTRSNIHISLCQQVSVHLPVHPVRTA